MAYIRNKNEERTGFQSGSHLSSDFDCRCDFAMVYRVNDSTLERIKQHKEKGYVIHLMTGISWGGYTDYLYGEYDGINHWDEAQTDRYGNIIAHGVDTPYMVPTVAFADYITEKLKTVVDMGVEAIHVEEPEFWDRAGYSEAFKREFKLYYRTEWSPPHESLDARYKCAKLKAYLYTRTIDRVSSALKEYAAVKYNRVLRFYVPTHSLLNYTQWKIVSPEGRLADIAGVDGCIAQVWTGTSREMNWFNGQFKERTFETAYLEYGVMQELVKGTGRQMWFLHDPIEDNPIFDWTDYRQNYYKTVVASLLHPKVNTYEICPWPNRVFQGKYPSDSPDAEPIPPEYATLLNNNFNTLGTLEEGEESHAIRVGILMGDCQLYQREYPDSEFSSASEEKVGTVLREDKDIINRFKNELANGSDDRELMLKFISSNAFPAFYGLALPLLKYGVAVRPVLLDNVRRYTGYLDDYDVLAMSYEFMKPDYPDVNNSIAEWVKHGGQLIYIGDGFDPYHKIESWWTGKYPSPAEHLFDMLGIEANGEKLISDCLNGTVGVWKTNPSAFCLSKEKADAYRAFFEENLAKKGRKITYKNSLVIKRKPYIIAAVMDESINDNELCFEGLFADMFTPDFSIIKKKTLAVGENAMLFDLNEISGESLCVIGTSLRVDSLSQDGEKITLCVSGASKFRANIRLRVPFEIKTATVDGESADCVYDSESKTVLVSFDSTGKDRKIILA